MLIGFLYLVVLYVAAAEMSTVILHKSLLAICRDGPLERGATVMEKAGGK